VTVGEETMRPMEWLWVQELQIIALIMLIAYSASRKMGLVIAMGVAMYVIGAFDLWDQAMQTIAIMLVSISHFSGDRRAGWRDHRPLQSHALGGQSGARSDADDPELCVSHPGGDAVRSGQSSGDYRHRNLCGSAAHSPHRSGIRQVDSEVTEASRAFGATRFQILKDVQLPLAMPSIMQGINQTTMMALAMVVIASMIGARGVGETVLLGLQRNDPGRGLLGGLAIVVLAIVLTALPRPMARGCKAIAPPGIDGP
jgi:glycine betaine/proline transport system permease protein